MSAPARVSACDLKHPRTQPPAGSASRFRPPRARRATPSPISRPRCVAASSRATCLRRRCGTSSAAWCRTRRRGTARRCCAARVRRAQSAWRSARAPREAALRVTVVAVCVMSERRGGDGYAGSWRAWQDVTRALACSSLSRAVRVVYEGCVFAVFCSGSGRPSPRFVWVGKNMSKSSPRGWRHCIAWAARYMHAWGRPQACRRANRIAMKTLERWQCGRGPISSTMKSDAAHRRRRWYSKQKGCMLGGSSAFAVFMITNY